MPDAQAPQAIRAALGQRSVVLVGLMGCGKSAIGRRLAARLALPFVDADEEIEKAAGKSIEDIFTDHGEPYFRDGERKVLARLLRSGPQVLATGGGAFMNDETRAAIAALGISVWLKAELALLVRRVGCELGAATAVSTPVRRLEVDEVGGDEQCVVELLLCEHPVGLGLEREHRVPGVELA